MQLLVVDQPCVMFSGRLRNVTDDTQASHVLEHARTRDARHLNLMIVRREGRPLGRQPDKLAPQDVEKTGKFARGRVWAELNDTVCTYPLLLDRRATVRIRATNLNRPNR